MKIEVIYLYFCYYGLYMKWKYPVSKIDPVIDNLHSYKVVDNYRWLENGDSQEVKKWVAEQNKFSLNIIKQNGHFDIFHDELAEHFEIPMFSNPIPVKGMYFWQERRPGQDQWVIYVKEGLDGKPKPLVDPNGMKKDNTVSIDYWYVSPNGTYLAYGLSEGGDEITTLYIKQVASGEDLKDKVLNAQFSELQWLPDETGFFYTRGPRPGTVPKDEERYHVKVFFHKLGTNPDNDELIFGKDRPKDDMIGLTLSLDGRYLGISVFQNWNRNDLYLYDTSTKLVTTLIEGLDAQFSIFSTEDRFLLKTNLDAENYKILTTPIGNVPKSINDWQEFIPESENLLDWFSITADKILVGYMVDACDEVKLFNYDGKELGKLPLPAFSSIAGIGCRRQEKEFFFGITNFFSPKVIYQCDPVTNEYIEYRRNDEPLNPVNYVVKQEWATSKDGVKFPMFIMHHKEVILDGKNPTILYGYGCHGISQTPSFLRSYIPWFKRKGVFVIANIRGGGEYGEQWHRDGSLDKKQNTFDDFIAAAEYLIDTKITNPKLLGIMGGSNGGLMVGAVMTQRPELFNAVVCRVPVLDLYRFHKFLIAGRWVHEFGDPEKANEFEWLRKWSPYHHVQSGIEYPNVLFTTANKDTRVAPLHAWKMTALLQANNKKNVVLLRTEMEAGHGPGKPIKKAVESQAYTLAFLAWELGLNL